jgi:hypothetical protein
VLLLLSAIAAAVPLLFVFVFCGEWAEGGGAKEKEGRRTFYLSPGMFFGQHLGHAKGIRERESGGMCIYSSGRARGKRAGWKMLLTVLFRPAACPSLRPLLLLLSCIYTLFSLSLSTVYVRVPTQQPPTTSGPYFPFSPFFYFADVASDLFLLFWAGLLLLLFLGASRLPVYIYKVLLVVLLLIS